MNKDISLKSRIGELHITLKIGLVIFLIVAVPFFVAWKLDSIGIISIGNFELRQTPPFFWSSIILIITGIVLTIRKRKKQQDKKFADLIKMKNKVFIGTTLVGLIIGGISYWFLPSERLNFGEPLVYLTWIIGTFCGSLLLVIYLNEKPPKIALLVFLGVVLAVYVRIHFDMDSFGEYDSHNLLPIEFIFCGIITIPSAFAGAYLGLLIKMFKKRFNK